jgi:hypothetical protein
MNERSWVLFSHIGTLLGYFIGIGGFIIPLVIWLSKKDESELISRHAKESLNFQLSLLIYMSLAAILIVILIGFPMLFILFVVDVVCVILATLKADKGEFYRYPMTIRFIS